MLSLPAVAMAPQTPELLAALKLYRLDRLHGKATVRDGEACAGPWLHRGLCGLTCMLMKSTQPCWAVQEAWTVHANVLAGQDTAVAACQQC